MTQVERDGSGFVVPATLLAQAFKLTEDRIRQAMRDGSLTSICEAGVDAHAVEGGHRLGRGRPSRRIDLAWRLS